MGLSLGPASPEGPSEPCSTSQPVASLQPQFTQVLLPPQAPSQALLCIQADHKTTCEAVSLFALAPDSFSVF